MIVEEVGEDWLALKLSCKALAAVMPGKLRDVLRRRCDAEDATSGATFFHRKRMVKWQVLQALLRLEYKDSKRRQARSLVCDGCVRFLPRASFADAQAKEQIRKMPSDVVSGRSPYMSVLRECMMRIMKKRGNYYPTRESFLVGGKHSWMCCLCLTVSTCPESGADKNHVKATVEQHGIDDDIDARLSRMKVCIACDAKLNEGEKDAQIA